MADTTTTHTGTGSGSDGSDQLSAPSVTEAAVRESREQLAQTVRALQERTDVKARVGGWAAEHRPALLGAGVGVVLVAVLVVVRRRR